jgi:hypothetical protein
MIAFVLTLESIEKQIKLFQFFFPLQTNYIFAKKGNNKRNLSFIERKKERKKEEKRF